MNKVIHRAGTRGYFDYGWLKTNHTFSFARYYEAQRMNFGMLRVLNDDIVAPGQGFGTHSHNDMEIVSIPLSGAMAHKDSTGNEEIIYPNDVQVMSAGTGILHSEYNHSKEKDANFLQLWILPNKIGHEPRYDQKSFNPDERKNKFQTIVSPEKNDGSLWLNQDAYLSITHVENGKSLKYCSNLKDNGIYIFVIEGSVFAADEKLDKRDGIGVWNVEEITIRAKVDAQVLFIEVPME